MKLFCTANSTTQVNSWYELNIYLHDQDFHTLGVYEHGTGSVQQVPHSVQYHRLGTNLAHHINLGNGTHGLIRRSTEGVEDS